MTILLDKETMHSKPCMKIFAYKTCVLVKSECNNPVEGLTINALGIHLFSFVKKISLKFLSKPLTIGLGMAAINMVPSICRFL